MNPLVAIILVIGLFMAIGFSMFTIAVAALLLQIPFIVILKFTTIALAAFLLLAVLARIIEHYLPK